MLSHGPWVSGSVDLCRQGCDFKARLTLVYVETRPIYGAKLSQKAIFSGTWCIFKKLLPGPLFVKPHLNGLIGEENPSFKSVEGSNGNLLPLFRRTDKSTEQPIPKQNLVQLLSAAGWQFCIVFPSFTILYDLRRPLRGCYLYLTFAEIGGLITMDSVWKNSWCFYEVLPGLQMLSN